MLSQEIDVFLSSDQKEFEKERNRLSKIICNVPFCSCIPLEKRGADARDVVDASLKAARNCDVYVGIFGRKYSETTIKEYEEVLKHRKPCLSYVKKVKRRDKKLKEFVENELKNQWKYYEFRGKDLYKQVENDLRRLIFETLKDGLEFRKREKEEVRRIIDTGRKSVFTIRPREDPLTEAQLAYTQGNYLECLINTTIALELVLKRKLKEKTEVADRSTLGQLLNLATRYNIIDRNMMPQLLEISHIRNEVVHGMRTPDKKTTALILESARRIFESLQ